MIRLGVTGKVVRLLVLLALVSSLVAIRSWIGFVIGSSLISYTSTAGLKVGVTAFTEIVKTEKSTTEKRNTSVSPATSMLPLIEPLPWKSRSGMSVAFQNCVRSAKSSRTFAPVGPCTGVTSTR